MSTSSFLRIKLIEFQLFRRQEPVFSFTSFETISVKRHCYHSNWFPQEFSFWKALTMRGVKHVWTLLGTLVDKPCLITVRSTDKNISVVRNLLMSLSGEIIDSPKKLSSENKEKNRFPLFKPDFAGVVSLLPISLSGHHRASWSNREAVYIILSDSRRVW